MLRLPRDQLVGPSSLVLGGRYSFLTSTATAAFSTSARVTAAKAAVGSGGKKVAGAARGSRPGSDAGDTKLEAIKRTLLDTSPSDADRLASLEAALPPLEAHETIVRAWDLHKRHRREAHSAELARKYAAMQDALALLEETDPGLWDMATRGSKGKQGELLVPKEHVARASMDVASGAVWDHNWKAPATETK